MSTGSQRRPAGLGDDGSGCRQPRVPLANAGKRRAAITSVFPSTTASAITTSYTGRTPLEHGLTGWFAYFGEAGCVGAPLPFMSQAAVSVNDALPPVNCW